MENIIIIKIDENRSFNDILDNIFVKNVSDGRLYMGNNSNNILSEIKTDNSNNWAKTFFYGGD